MLHGILGVAMNQIMLSVQPKWAEKILNGTKTIEIRKSVPKELPCEVYLYVTKAEPYLNVHKGTPFEDGELYTSYFLQNCPLNFEEHTSKHLSATNLNGRVVAKFTLNKANTLEHCQWVNQQVETYTPRGIISNFEILDKACLNIVELCAYGKGKPLYAWHIDDLVIFDRPMELGEFRNIGKAKIMGKQLNHVWKSLTRAPQSWCRVCATPKGE